MRQRTMELMNSQQAAVEKASMPILGPCLAIAMLCGWIAWMAGLGDHSNGFVLDHAWTAAVWLNAGVTATRVAYWRGAQ